MFATLQTAVLKFFKISAAKSATKASSSSYKVGAHKDPFKDLNCVSRLRPRFRVLLRRGRLHVAHDGYSHRVGKEEQVCRRLRGDCIESRCRIVTDFDRGRQGELYGAGTLLVQSLDADDCAAGDWGCGGGGWVVGVRITSTEDAGIRGAWRAA